MKPLKLQPVEHHVVCYHHKPEPGVTIADVLKPDYWTHVAPQLRIGYRVEVMAEDGAWWAMLLVRAVGQHEAVLQALQHVTLGAEAPTVDLDGSAYEVKWAGPSAQFRIVRKSDSEVIKDKFPIREAAEEWLAKHLLNMAA